MKGHKVNVGLQTRLGFVCFVSPGAPGGRGQHLQQDASGFLAVEEVTQSVIKQHSGF